MKTNLLLLFCLTFSIQLVGQNKFVASNDQFGQRVFIKNNGQFEGVLPNGKTIDYAYSNGDEQVYFNKNGVTYLLQKRYPISHSQMEAKERGEKIKIKPTKKAFVEVYWENSNPNVEIVVSDKQSHYQSYGDEKLKSDCFKKITYKNIYDNIDIEYVFTDERNDGIKYTILVHPGGNVNNVKIKYAGDIRKVVLKNGNVVIKTDVRNITELAPISYQNGISIVSNFKVKNNTISFELPNFYDKTKDLSIDPWVINLSFATNNYGYDADFDYAGNYYVYGGSGPFLISKYSAAGVLLWTFNGIVPSVGWSSNPVVNYPSNFIVDKVSGDCYTGQGFNYGTQIIRINSLGMYDYFISTTNTLWEEVWDMGYDCNSGKIFGLGGGTTSNVSAGIIDSNTAIIVPQNFTGISSAGQDVVSHAIDSNGTVYFLFSTGFFPQLSNTLLKANSTFNGNEWSLMETNYDTFEELRNKTYPGANLQTYNSNGFNALAANNSYLYYYDGFNLAAYSKTNGIRIAFTTLSGQIVKQQGGIAVDECNNIYVGGNGFIQCFNFNGTTFVSNGAIPVASTTLLKYVTDIKLKQGSNELYVSGSGFGGVYSAINSGSCSSSATIGIVQSQVAINNTTAQATITTTLVAPVISYTWLNSSNVIVSQTNNSTALTNTVTNLVNGTYSLVAQFNAPCGFTTTQTFNVSSTATITPTFTQVNSICAGSFLAALPTISNNSITGTWSPALNNTTTTLYTFTPNAGQNATTAAMTITVINPVNPTFTQVSPICSGTFLSNLPTTSNNVIIGTWAPAVNNTQTTLYTFTPTLGQCATNTQMTIQINQPIVPTFTQVLPICSGTLLSNLPTTSNNSITGTWLPNTNNIQTTTYNFTPTVGQCTTTTQMTIVVNPIRVPTFSQIPAICYQGIIPSLPILDSNGISGTWQPSIVSATSTGNYVFTPTIGQCTTSNFIMPITVFDDFDFEIKQTCVGDDFVLQVVPLSNSFDLNTANYVWKNSSNLTVGLNNERFNVTNYMNSNSILPQFPLFFSVDVMLPNGCTKSHGVSIKSIYCSIQKGISPNDDTQNEFFDLQLLNVKKLEIFNRYGTMVYSKSNYINQWTGQSDDGGELPVGVYYYVIEFNEDRPTSVGWIYLTR